MISTSILVSYQVYHFYMFISKTINPSSSILFMFTVRCITSIYSMSIDAYFSGGSTDEPSFESPFPVSVLPSAGASSSPAPGTHNPESTHRFMWYLASSSGIFRINCCSIEMSFFSKQSCISCKLEDVFVNSSVKRNSAKLTTR